MGPRSLDLRLCLWSLCNHVSHWGLGSGRRVAGHLGFGSGEPERVADDRIFTYRITGGPLLPWSLCLQCFDLKCWGGSIHHYCVAKSSILDSHWHKSLCVWKVRHKFLDVQRLSRRMNRMNLAWAESWHQLLPSTEPPGLIGYRQQLWQKKTFT